MPDAPRLGRAARRPSSPRATSVPAVVAAALGASLAACGADPIQGTPVHPIAVQRLHAGSAGSSGGKTSGDRTRAAPKPYTGPRAELSDSRAKVPSDFRPVEADPPFGSEWPGLYGGTVSIGILGEQIDTFNPLTATEATANELKVLVFDPLVSYDNEKWEDRPGLAWKWEHSPDGLVWTFHLRKGVKWGDGRDLTAADVVFTFMKTVFNPKIPNSDVDGFKIGNSPLPVFTAVDPHTVRADCSAVDALFLTHIGSVSIVPEHLWKDTVVGDLPAYNAAMSPDRPETVIGTGPFRIVSYSTGEKIVYERNPWSWRTNVQGQRLPFADRIVVKMVKDNTTRSLQYLSSGFDLIDDIQVTDFRRFAEKEAEGWFSLHRLGLHVNTIWLSFNQNPGKDSSGDPKVAPWKLGWFQDRRFRRAMSHAIDRDRLVKNIVEGRGEPIYSSTTRSNVAWYADVPRFPYDPERAAALLDSMGLGKLGPDGIRVDAAGRRVSFDLWTNVENKVRCDIIAQLKEFFGAVGVEAVPKPVAFHEISAQMSDVHKWDAIVLGWGSSVPPDPLNGKNVHHSSGRLHVWYPQQPAPFTAWEQAGDAILDVMSGIPDAEDRRPYYESFLQMEALEQSTVWLYAPNCYAASRTRIGNVRPALLRPSTWWNIEELFTTDGE